MVHAYRLAGFIGAHAIWSVSDGGPLVPFLGSLMPNGSRQLERFATDPIEVGVGMGKEQLARNPGSAKAAVLAFDGYIPVQGSRTDAVILEIRDYDSPDRELTVALPYRPASRAGLLRKGQPFAIYRPKFFPVVGKKDREMEELGMAFWDGISDHTESGSFWNSHFDGSK